MIREQLNHEALECKENKKMLIGDVKNGLLSTQIGKKGIGSKNRKEEEEEERTRRGYSKKKRG